MQGAPGGEQSVTESPDTFWPFLLRYNDPCKRLIIKKFLTDFLLNLRGGGQQVRGRLLKEGWQLKQQRQLHILICNPRYSLNSISHNAVQLCFSVSAGHTV